MLSSRLLPAAMRRNDWRGVDLLLAALLVVLGIAVTYDAWRDIARIALRDEEASQILLVPLVFAGLFWVRRGRLRQCSPDRRWIGPALVAAGWGLHAWGDAYAIQSFWHFGAIVVAVGCLASVAGRDVLVRFAPAFAVLVFLVPVPGVARQAIAMPLQSATAGATEIALATLGADVSRSGNVLSINGKAVEIAEACNGLRMVFALALVAYAFAFTTPLRPSARAVVLVLSPVVAIACNVVRLLPTVWVFGNADHAFAEKVHDIAGWAMVPVAFVGMLGVLRVLRWARIPVTQYTLAHGP